MLRKISLALFAWLIVLAMLLFLAVSVTAGFSLLFEIVTWV